MATIYKHKRSDLASKTPPVSADGIGELTLNLATGRAQTVRQLTTGTFIGTVESTTTSGTLTEIILTENLIVALSDNAIIAVRSTDSDVGVTSPNINSASVNQAHAVTTNTFTVDDVQGRAFAAGDFIWLLDGATTDELVNISGHSTASAYPPAEPTIGDLWVDTSDPADPLIKIFNDAGEFQEFVSDAGGSGGGGGGLGSGDLASEDSDVVDVDFGGLTTLSFNGAVDMTYSAVDYNFGGIRSPRPGPDFGEIIR